MPVTVTFDLSRPRPDELNRLRSAFERLGWQRLGNTAYRYPALGEQPDAEDWFNCVVPALMMLAAYSRFAAARGRGLARFTIDAQSMTGLDHESQVGMLPAPVDEMDLSAPSPGGRAFAEQRLRDWLAAIQWPYAPDDEA